MPTGVVGGQTETGGGSSSHPTPGCGFPAPRLWSIPAVFSAREGQAVHMRSHRYIATTLAVALVALSAVALAAAKPSPSYSQALKKVDAQLRFSIEVIPPALAQGIDATKAHCEAAQELQQRGDPQAPLEWQAVTQAVDQIDMPRWREIIQASGRAHSRLEELQATFSKAWKGQHQKVTTLNVGALNTEHGVRLYLASIREFSDAFESWKQHDCAAAEQVVQSVNQHITPAVKAINQGMDTLESLR